MSILSMSVVAVPAEVPRPFPAPSTSVGWQWVPIEGSKCMSGKETGVHLKYASKRNSTKLALYLSGGGACFNVATCATATSSAHPNTPGMGGLFSETDARNALKDYHWIHVPYCTGDVHMGSVVNRVGGLKHHFNGRANLEQILARAQRTFPFVTELFITGESAGGFGAFANFPYVRGHWPKARAALLDDSGPVLDDTSRAPCLQASFRNYWDLNAALPAGCPCIGDGGNLSSGWAWFKQQYPKDSIALVSSIHDKVISMFFSFGEEGDDRCPSALPRRYDKIYAGLRRLAAKGIPVFMLPGSEHTHTGSKASFYSAAVGGVKLSEWVAQLVDAKRPDPATVDPAATEPTAAFPAKESLSWKEYLEHLALHRDTVEADVEGVHLH